MRIDADGFFHLTYCTNIHAADGWAAVDANIRRFAPALKRRLSPDAPFGIGLRLSAQDARELLAGHLESFRAYLDREGLYVAIINGFPYGSFHRSVVKADVYAPDWREEARVAYTLDLIDILQALLPADVDGGVSTAPLSYKTWLGPEAHADWARVTQHVVLVAERLARLRRDHGQIIHLDIEPEPDCSIENTDEAIAFFDRWLIPHGAPPLSAALGVSVDEAELALREHVRLCFDCCHFAVEYEDPVAALDRLARAGIKIGRIQLSSALKVHIPAEPVGAQMLIDRLRPFADSTYLHQVIQRRASSLQHYPDLDAAFASHPHGDSEWRIHFHVPLFTSEYDGLGSTQDDVRSVIEAARRRHVTRHLEIETYTWDVLPGALKIDLLESIGREFDWVLNAFRRGWP